MAVAVLRLGTLSLAPVYRPHLAAPMMKHVRRRGPPALSQAPPLTVPWGASFRKYLNICRATLVERMAYRSDFLIGTFLRFLPVLTTLLLWNAVYAGSGKEKIAGFPLPVMISYLLLIHISRMFSSMPGLAGGIARDIRDGSLKKYLVQPLDMIGYLLAYRVAHKAAYIVTSALPYALLFFLARDNFVQWGGWQAMPAYAASLIMAFLIGFFFEAMIGLAGFWLLEVTSVIWIVTTLNYFVSGQMFPLEVLNLPKYSYVYHVLQCLPFKYLAYFPAMVFLGEIRGEALVRELLIEACWVVALVLMTRWLYATGLRRYSAFGG
jgi:ABC-2 type transport system permease protein